MRPTVGVVTTSRLGQDRLTQLVSAMPRLAFLGLVRTGATFGFADDQRELVEARPECTIIVNM